MPRVNQEILLWARRSAGLSEDEAVQRLGIRDARGKSAIERLVAFEDGTDAPARGVLTRMAKVYRRPLLTFYLSAPPQRGARGEDFRTLPATYTAAEDGLVDALVRDIRARQNIVREAMVVDGEPEKVGFINSISMEVGIGGAVQAMEAILGGGRAEYRAAGTLEQAFKWLRGRVERARVFVLLQGDLGSHRSTIDVEAFRGFALADKVAPFIVINDNDSVAAWTFTLLHELAHLLLGETGISNGRAESQVERFCNDAASAFLVSNAEIATLRVQDDLDVAHAQAAILAFARPRRVSGSMVAYRLQRQGCITFGYWEQLNAQFRQLWLRNRTLARQRARENEGGPNYYIVRRHRVGEALIQFVKETMSGGALTTTKASQVLGVKPPNVGTLIEGVTPGRGRAA